MEINYDKPRRLYKPWPSWPLNLNYWPPIFVFSPSVILVFRWNLEVWSFVRTSSPVEEIFYPGFKREPFRWWFRDAIIKSSKYIQINKTSSWPYHYGKKEKNTFRPLGWTNICHRQLSVGQSSNFQVRKTPLLPNVFGCSNFSYGEMAMKAISIAAFERSAQHSALAHDHWP